MSRKKRVKEEPKGSNDAFVLMSDILDKLQIVNYEIDFLPKHEFQPLNPGFFAYPLKSAGAQFSYFAALSDWLLRCNNHKFTSWNDFDDPNSISSSILAECAKLGFKDNNVTAVKLKQGSGLEVCQILDFLLNLQLKAKNYQILPIIYHKPKIKIKNKNKDKNRDESSKNDSNETGTNEEKQSDQISESRSVTESDMASVAEDIIESDNDSAYQNATTGNDDPFNFDNNNNLYKENNNMSNIDEDEHKTTMSVMHTSVLPSEWKLELERVSHKLNEKYFNVGVKDWILHLNKTKLHSKTLNILWPQCETKLKKNEQMLSNLLNRLSNKEKSINHEFVSLKQNYERQHSKLTKLTATHNEYVEKVGSLTSMLQELNQSIQDMKLEMENANNAMTDTSPIRRLREIHNQLKNELRELDTKIGVTRQALQKAKMIHERTYSARN